MALVNREEKRTEKESTENNVVAFLNWGAINKKGEVALKGSKGFAIFDNQYTSKQEKQLVKLAEKNGGEITIPMTVTIRLNAPQEAADLDVDDFI